MKCPKCSEYRFGIISQNQTVFHLSCVDCGFRFWLDCVHLVWHNRDSEIVRAGTSAFFRGIYCTQCARESTDYHVYPEDVFPQLILEDYEEQEKED